MMHGILWSRFGLGATVMIVILHVSTVEAQDAASKAEPAAPGITANDARASIEMSGRLEEIVVTARKWSEDVQSVPGSVDVIGSQGLADAHVTKLDDLASLVSNLNIVTRGDNTPDVVLRGVGSFGVVQGVGFYANDVQLFDGQTVRPDDLERVEVLKGPQGTLYGGSNIGGAIKYVTKLPTDQFEGKASVEAGNYDSQTYSGLLSGPLSPGVLDGRASFFHTTTRGFIYDTTLGRYVNNGTETGGRLTLLNTMESTTTTLYLSANRNRSGVGANLYYTPGIPEDPAAATAFSLNVRDGTLPEYSQDLYSAVLNIQHQFSEALTVTSISSWFHSNETTTTDTDKGPFPILTGYQLFHHEVWSEELRLASNMDQHLGQGTLRWIIGAFAQGDNPDVVEQTVFFTGTDFTDPTQTSNPANFASTTIHPVQHHKEYALFGNAMYDWGRWGFQAGLRGDYHWSSMSDPLWGVSAGQHNSLVMPLFSASYHFEPSTMGYMTISRGFEPGDFAEGFNANNTPVLNPFRPETIWNYELGLKSTLLDRVRFNTAVFYTNYQGRLFQTNVLEAGTIIGVTENIGPSHNYGAEFDLTTRIVPELYLNASFGFTRAIWGNVPYLDTDLGFASGVPAVPTNLNGRLVDFTPAYQGSLTLDWSHSVTSDWTFGARPSLAFFGREYWDPTDHYHQPAYHLVNFNMRLDNKHWEISANVSNVFNKLYNTAFISAAELAAPFNSASIGRPRLWSGTVSYRW
jgi:iron complex outermembrane receptor protein